MAGTDYERSGRRKPWRAIPLGRLLHRPGEELRVELFWLTEADPVRLELRQWDMRSEAPIPTRHCIQLSADSIPWLLETLTRAALEAGPNNEENES